MSILISDYTKANQTECVGDSKSLKKAMIYLCVVVVHEMWDFVGLYVYVNTLYPAISPIDD